MMGDDRHMRKLRGYEFEETVDWTSVVSDMYETTLIENAFNEMMAAEMMAREKQLYAAWRAGYDYLYVLSSFQMTDLSLEFIPSNEPDRMFDGKRVERYDLREKNLSPRAKEILMEFKP